MREHLLNHIYSFRFFAGGGLVLVALIHLEHLDQLLFWETGTTIGYGGSDQQGVQFCLQ